MASPMASIENLYLGIAILHLGSRALDDIFFL